MKTSLKKIVGHVEQFAQDHPRIVYVGVILVAILLIVSRRPQAITYPQFWAEDGKFWFADAYTSNPFASVFLLYDGYFVVAYRAVASLSLLLPLKFAPLFFNLAAIAAQITPLFLINSTRLKKIIPLKSLAVLVSILYVALPNSAEVFLNLTNIQWHLGIAAFLVLVAEKSDKLVWKIFDYVILIATGLSGPLIILLLPIAGYLFYKKRTSYNKRNLIVAAVLSVVQLLGIFVLSGFHRVGGQSGVSLLKLIKMVVGQIFVGGLFGQRGVDFLYPHTALLVVIFCLLVALLVYVFKVGPEWLKLFNIYGLMVIVTMLASLKPIAGVDLWRTLTVPGIGQRYWYIPIFILVTTLLWLVFRAGVKPLRYLSLALLLCLVVVGIPHDWRLKPYPDQHFQHYVTIFDQAPSGTTVDIPINPGGSWSMSLTKK